MGLFIETRPRRYASGNDCLRQSIGGLQCRPLLGRVYNVDSGKILGNFLKTLKRKKNHRDYF